MVERSLNIYISYYDEKGENNVLNDIISKQNIELSDSEKLSSNILLNYVENTQKTSINQINNSQNERFITKHGQGKRTAYCED